MAIIRYTWTNAQAFLFIVVTGTNGGEEVTDYYALEGGNDLPASILHEWVSDCYGNGVWRAATHKECQKYEFDHLQINC